jgi:hypothetical protein
LMNVTYSFSRFRYLTTLSFESLGWGKERDVAGQLPQNDARGQLPSTYPTQQLPESVVHLPVAIPQDALDVLLQCRGKASVEYQGAVGAQPGESIFQSPSQRRDGGCAPFQAAGYLLEIEPTDYLGQVPLFILKSSFGSSVGRPPTKCSSPALASRLGPLLWPLQIAHLWRKTHWRTPRSACWINCVARCDC